MRKYKGSEFEIRRNTRYTTRSTHYYEVKLYAGHWPTDNELIDLCDGGSTNFGGKVVKLSATQAEVSVYVD